ncbi:glycine-rich domain-containing protein [Kaistia sp. MMO-174]|uniref:glycine-rich domain-containing protein n=1 Tax=Kaistia sp. MMO-174 TaxID=3081256 RepID=UPI00301AB8CC
MADWILPNSSTPGAVTGDAYMDAVQAKVARLSQGVNIQLSGVGGTANDITATLDPAPISGLTNGMLFVLPVSVSNTGAVTLAINGGAAANVVDLLGAALTSGRFPAGSRQLLTFSDGAFISIGDSRIVTNILDYQAFTASGTWAKPIGTPGNAWVFVEGWGGGGGGRTNSGTNGGGGGGGGYMSRMFRASQISSSVSVIVGAGGAVNSNGTNSSFGSLLTFPAGSTGSDSTASNFRVGGTGGGFVGATEDFTGGGGGGYTSTSASSNFNTSGYPSYQGGGGGGGYNGATTGGAVSGGNSYWGGGGGGGARATGSASEAGGTSVMAGAGGARGQAGFTPAGGGGRGAAGARGEVRVWVVA